MQLAPQGMKLFDGEAARLPHPLSSTTPRFAREFCPWSPANEL